MDWTESGAFLVAHGTYRIPLPLPNDGLKAINCYLLEAPDSLTLIDAGFAIDEAWDPLESALASLGYDLGDVTRMIATHAHRDHYTLAVAVRRKLGTPLAIGAGEAPYIRAVRDENYVQWATQMELLHECGADETELGVAHLFDKRGPSTLFDEPDEWISGGDIIRLGDRSLHVVATPGHTVGHLVFTEPDAGLIFTGDHVLPTITPSIAFEPRRSTLPLGDYIRSLQLLRALPDAMLLPAHGAPTDSMHARVDELLAHHERRLDDALEIVRSGWSTGYEVAARLRWTRRSVELTDLDPFSRMLAVIETGFHLDLLVHRAVLSRQVLDDVKHYAIAGSWDAAERSVDAGAVSGDGQ